MRRILLRPVCKNLTSKQEVLGELKRLWARLLLTNQPHSAGRLDGCALAAQAAACRRKLRGRLGDTTRRHRAPWRPPRPEGRQVRVGRSPLRTAWRRKRILSGHSNLTSMDHTGFIARTHLSDLTRRVWVGVRTCLATRLEAQTSTSSYACSVRSLHASADPQSFGSGSGRVSGAWSGARPPAVMNSYYVLHGNYEPLFWFRRIDFPYLIVSGSRI